jgi:GH15 family glucan-1,4-alpha-glucosidase
MSLPLEAYALIGDCEAAALVSRHGSIDWLCLPEFDSDACLAALLGSDEHGCWQIAPQSGITHVERRYAEGTLILETDLTTREGAVRLVDFMPLRDGPPRLARLVSGLAGRVPMRMALKLRFAYGHVRPWVERAAGGVQAIAGRDKVMLRSELPLDWDGDAISAEFTVDAGQVVPFVLSHARSHEPPPAPVDIARMLAVTQPGWREWSARGRTDCDWPEAVQRSLIILKALTCRSTGAAVAAPTTSLPEEIGGKLNWDYRYCWLRDASFTMAALVNAGYHEEAAQWRDWLLRAIGGSPDKLQVMYHTDGARHIGEWQAKWLPGYAESSPVHLGNKASQQRQLDIYGEVICALRTAAEAGVPMTEYARKTEARLAAHLKEIWREPDQGLWESRGSPRQFTYSKVMCWAAVDRVLTGESARELDAAERAELNKQRGLIHEDVCRRAFDSTSNSFVRSYEAYSLDAALLRLPMVGFLPYSDPRIRGTIARIREDLDDHGFVRRFKTDFEDEDESHGQGVFLACSCWMAECLHRLGERAAARELFERVLAVRSDLGLLSEEYDTERGRLVGNYPLALSHIAVVNAAFTLSGGDADRHSS